MTDPGTLHDNFFRRTLSEKSVAHDFLQNYLPQAIVAHLALETLTICKDTFIAKTRKKEHDKEKRQADLLYRVNTNKGDSAFVYFLFEHKSYASHFVALQLLEYMVAIWQLHLQQHPKSKKLPTIIPIVIYHGDNTQQALGLRELVELPTPDFARYLPDFELAFYDFSAKSDLEIKGKILLQLVLNALRAKTDPKTLCRVKIILEKLSQLGDDATSIEWLRVILDYLSQVMEVEQGTVYDMLTDYLSEEKENAMATLAQQWWAEGRTVGETQGIQKGRKEGCTEGRIAALRRQLTRRFKEAASRPTILARIEAGTVEELDTWLDNILDARSIEEVFA